MISLTTSSDKVGFSKFSLERVKHSARHEKGVNTSMVTKPGLLRVRLRKQYRKPRFDSSLFLQPGRKNMAVIDSYKHTSSDEQIRART